MLALDVASHHPDEDERVLAVRCTAHPPVALSPRADRQIGPVLEAGEPNVKVLLEAGQAVCPYRYEYVGERLRVVRRGGVSLLL